MQEDAIDARRIDDHGVGAGFAAGDEHPRGQRGLVASDDAEDCVAEQVVADLAHQACRHAEAVQSEAGVRDGPAGGEDHGADFDERAGFQQVRQPAAVPSEGGDDVQANVTGHDDRGRANRHVSSSTAGVPRSLAAASRAPAPLQSPP